MSLWGKMFGMFGISEKEAKQNNYKLETFQDLDKVTETDIQKYSAVQKYFDQMEANASSMTYDFHNFTDILYGGVPTDKPMRLSNYRRMASFPEVSDAIDEICDDCINHDENGRLVYLSLNKGELDAIAKQEINDAFNEYISLFDFDNYMFEYMRDFVTDAELCWENIISKDHPEYGIIGINRIKPETFEFAFHIKTGKICGILISTKTQTQDTGGPMPVGGTNQQQVPGNWTNLQQVSNSTKVQNGEALFLPLEQLTYCNTGIYSDTGLTVYPVLEKARKAYNQLSLIEDSIIIYRLVRAPERLVFNVDCGNIPRQRAEQEVNKMAKRYSTKQVYNPITGSISSGYDSHSMLESYWFIKSAGSTGTEVTTLAGGQNLGELDDLNYFIRKLYISLKIPYNRYAESSTVIEKFDTINREEYRFSKFVMRQLNCVSAGLNQGFKTHLKLKGLWEQHKLQDRDFKIKFAPPTAFTIYEQMKLAEIRFNMYDLAAAHEELSQTLCQRKYLGWTDDEIEENWTMLEAERIRKATIERNVAKQADKDAEMDDFMSNSSETTEPTTDTSWTGGEIPG